MRSLSVLVIACGCSFDTWSLVAGLDAGRDRADVRGDLRELVDAGGEVAIDTGGEVTTPDDRGDLGPRTEGGIVCHGTVSECDPRWDCCYWRGVEPDGAVRPGQCGCFWRPQHSVCVIRGGPTALEPCPWD